MVCVRRCNTPTCGARVSRWAKPVLLRRGGRARADPSVGRPVDRVAQNLDIRANKRAGASGLGRGHARRGGARKESGGRGRVCSA
eukprot:2212453-Pleurochrysis_carterae.AAC.1